MPPKLIRRLAVPVLSGVACSDEDLAAAVLERWGPPVPEAVHGPRSYWLTAPRRKKVSARSRENGWRCSRRYSPPPRRPRSQRSAASSASCSRATCQPTTWDQSIALIKGPGGEPSPHWDCASRWQDALATDRRRWVRRERRRCSCGHPARLETLCPRGSRSASGGAEPGGSGPGGNPHRAPYVVRLARLVVGGWLGASLLELNAFRSWHA